MTPTTPGGTRMLRYGLVLLAGMLFGIVLVKGQVASWFRIQEMFHFQSFHMFGVIGSAVLVAMVSVQLLQRLGARAIDGAPIAIAAKSRDRGQIIGGVLFGIGWSLTGACPGPMYALLGGIGWPAAVMLLAALTGAWTYGQLRERLPH